jgi:hypothetical protein
VGRIIGIVIASISISVSILAILILVWDPVYSGLLLGLAVVLGGVSSVGRNNLVMLSICSVAFAASCALLLAHYSSTGFFSPTTSSVTNIAILLALPLAISAAFFGLGYFLRYRGHKGETTDHN